MHRSRATHPRRFHFAPLFLMGLLFATAAMAATTSTALAHVAGKLRALLGVERGRPVVLLPCLVLPEMHGTNLP